MKRLHNWFRKKLGWLLPPQYSVEERAEDEPPVKLNGRKVYLLGSPNPDIACLKCPGGCGKLIFLDLDENASIKWRIVKKNRLTIHPSIWNTLDCTCHFWIIRGEVKWCNDI
ncbi:DUF6527 family protein [Echinicola soli]|uniref:DUF6527 family protein n=1 Tax=Echinicola soli TaxID=2591634 RepID=UPI003743FFD8